jgi:hypothetical protein
MNLFLNAKVVPVLFSYQGARQALEIYEKERSAKGILKNLHLEEYELSLWLSHRLKNLPVGKIFMCISTVKNHGFIQTLQD